MFVKGRFYDVVKMKFPFGMCNSKRFFQHKRSPCTSCQHSAGIFRKRSGNILRLKLEDDGETCAVIIYRDTCESLSEKNFEKSP